MMYLGPCPRNKYQLKLFKFYLSSLIPRQGFLQAHTSQRCRIFCARRILIRYPHSTPSVRRRSPVHGFRLTSRTIAGNEALPFQVRVTPLLLPRSLLALPLHPGSLHFPSQLPGIPGLKHRMMTTTSNLTLIQSFSLIIYSGINVLFFD